MFHAKSSFGQYFQGGVMDGHGLFFIKDFQPGLKCGDIL
jgi:hypothetical protein